MINPDGPDWMNLPTDRPEPFQPQPPRDPASDIPDGWVDRRFPAPKLHPQPDLQEILRAARPRR